MRRLWRRKWVRRSLLVTALAVAWAVWAILPPSPIREWIVPFERKDAECLSPDGAYLARIYDCSWGEPNPQDWRVGVCHVSVARGVKAADGIPYLQPPPKPLLVGGGNDPIKVFRPDGQVLLTTPPQRIPGLISPDCSYFIATAYDHRPVAEVWDISTGVVRASLRNAQGPIALSDDNATVATSLLNSSSPIAIWDAKSGRQILVLGDKKDPIPGALAFGTSGHLLAAWPGSNSENHANDVALWDTSNGKRIACLPFQRTGATPVILEFSRGGRVLVARTDTVYDCWDLSTDPPRNLQEIIARLPNPFSVHWVRPHHLIFSRNHNRIIIPKVSGGTTSWVICDADSVAQIGEFVWSNASDAWPEFSDDGRWLATNSARTPPPAAGWVAWLERKLGNTLPWRRPGSYLRLFDLRAGVESGLLPVGFYSIGFDSDSRSFWSYSDVLEGNRQTGFRVFQTSLSPWHPPPWLLAVTAVGIILLILDCTSSGGKVLPSTKGTISPAARGPLASSIDSSAASKPYRHLPK